MRAFWAAYLDPYVLNARGYIYFGRYLDDEQACLPRFVLCMSRRARVGSITIETHQSKLEHQPQPSVFAASTLV